MGKIKKCMKTIEGEEDLLEVITLIERNPSMVCKLCGQPMPEVHSARLKGSVHISCHVVWLDKFRKERKREVQSVTGRSSVVVPG